MGCLTAAPFILFEDFPKKPSAAPQGMNRTTTPMHIGQGVVKTTVTLKASEVNSHVTEHLLSRLFIEESDEAAVRARRSLDMEELVMTLPGSRWKEHGFQILMVEATSSHQILMMDVTGSHQILMMEVMGSHQILMMEVTGGHQILMMDVTGSHQILMMEVMGSHQILMMEVTGGHQILMMEVTGGHQILMMEATGGHQILMMEVTGGHQILMMEVTGGLQILMMEVTGGHQILMMEVTGGHQILMMEVTGGHQILMMEVTGGLQILMMEATGGHQILMMERMIPRVISYIQLLQRRVQETQSKLDPHSGCEGLLPLWTPRRFKDITIKNRKARRRVRRRWQSMGPCIPQSSSTAALELSPWLLSSPADYLPQVVFEEVDIMSWPSEVVQDAAEASAFSLDHSYLSCDKSHTWPLLPTKESDTVAICPESTPQGPAGSGLRRCIQVHSPKSKARRLKGPQSWAFSLPLTAPESMSVDRFFEALGLIYDEPDRVRLAEDTIMGLVQGERSAEWYSSEFRRWSTEVSWDDLDVCSGVDWRIT
ncbi:unnamed protein product [Ranitomeya imitator]|uniref:Retrotransposon gag domain-containing protein n=1 Tax=Ranitomeya imitator TaxID=111125 RepID=A0ABN9MKF8_9NEOB|nr:unnamed protein product [Ranitomeya imitator]